MVTLHAGAQPVSQNLDSGWQFSEQDKNEWMPATVPGTVHTDLMANKKIDDPFFSGNESKVQWVETKTWEYKTTFDCSEELWKQTHRELDFEGLDTYADVYLNDSLLFTAEDMFLSYSFDVTKLLKKKSNVLRVVFHPASELIEKNRERSDFKNLPGGDRVFIRKAQYQFGWDWGPRLVTCGIWKPVQLTGWSSTRIVSVNYRMISLGNDTAYVECDANLYA
ncbi:MAG TPA: glycoside hydrolase family 2 protein, partial [Bacteroidia bacterium]|nr:glycoside hydrolase family 2 protein [Bacteroidia bacterium]